MSGTAVHKTEGLAYPDDVPPVRRPAVEVIERNGAQLREAFAPLLPPGTPYALLDFPDHHNIGDSAIWSGGVRLLRDLTGREAGYVSSTGNFDADGLRRAVPEGPIMLHGGGNFGDIYDRHQRFREHVMASFPDRTIVQMPQSIHYRDAARAAETARAIATHGDVHLFVRDRRSVEFAARHLGCEARLAPDCAFALGPLPPIPLGESERAETLLLFRRDVERVEHDAASLFPGAREADWPREDARFRRGAVRQAALRALLAGRWSRVRRRGILFDTLAERRVARGLRILSGGKRVVTDRLHGHILCLLLGIPHVAMDNDYGKIAAYAAQWTADADILRLADTPESARAALDELGGSERGRMAA